MGVKVLPLDDYIYGTLKKRGKRQNYNHCRTAWYDFNQISEFQCKYKSFKYSIIIPHLNNVHQKGQLIHGNIYMDTPDIPHILRGKGSIHITFTSDYI